MLTIRTTDGRTLDVPFESIFDHRMMNAPDWSIAHVCLDDRVVVFYAYEDVYYSGRVVSIVA